MAGRIRSLKPEWLDDQKLAALPDDARVLSIALILEADDYGRGRAHPSYLAGSAWRYDISGGLAKLPGALASLSGAGFVTLYRVDDEEYYEIRTWKKNQRVDKPGKPRIPPPPEIPKNPRETPGNIPETLAPDLRPPTSDLRPPITTTSGSRMIGLAGKTEDFLRVEHTHPRPGPSGKAAPIFHDKAAVHGGPSVLADKILAALEWQIPIWRTRGDIDKIRYLEAYIADEWWTEPRPKQRAVRVPEEFIPEPDTKNHATPAQIAEARAEYDTTYANLIAKQS